MAGHLTGGSGDINPQLMRTSQATDVADTTVSSGLAVPITRLPGAGKKVTIIEFLKVNFLFANFPVMAAGDVQMTQAIYLCTSNPGAVAVSINDPRVVCGWHRMREGAFTALQGFGFSHDNTHTCDMTDGAGHGILVATDNIYFQIQSTNVGATTQCNISMLYRFKRVDLANYVGIVQSQQ